MAAEEAGVRPRIRASAVSAVAVQVIGMFQKDVREVAEILDQFRRPLVVSHDKFAAAVGVEVTAHREALAATLDWYRSAGR